MGVFESKSLLYLIQAWNAFEEDLIYKNRFFQKSDMLDEITKIINECADSIDEGTILFRAREYIPEDLDLNTEEKENERSLLLTASENSTWSTIINNPTEKTFIPILSLLKKKDSTLEWGYSKKESGKPDREKAGLNRASPRYISYLYLANDVNTSLAEVRAQINQRFSVALYRITKSLRIVNFKQDLKLFKNANEEFEETAKEITLYTNIIKAFSAPSNSNEKDYIVSQYIAEYIKTLGFDGIAYGSSRKNDGTN